MISQETWKISTILQKMLKNIGDLSKLIVAIGFEKLPKVVQLLTTENSSMKFNFSNFWPLIFASV